MVPAGAVPTGVKYTVETIYSLPAATASHEFGAHAPSPLRNTHLPNNQRNDLLVSKESQAIIEYELNGPFAVGRVCAFPLSAPQYAGLQSKIGRTITLKNYTFGFRWEIELLDLYSPDDWAILMSFKPMDPIYVSGERLNRGCKIRFIKRIL